MTEKTFYEIKDLPSIERRAAAKIATDQETLTLLAIYDPDTLVRSYAVAKIKDRETLLDILKMDKDPLVRWTAEIRYEERRPMGIIYCAITDALWKIFGR